MKAKFFAKLSLSCLLCASFIFAEENSFNTLRGFAYNPYGTLGAPPTIADILQKPSDIYGHKFVYISPAFNQGYSAVNLADESYVYVPPAYNQGYSAFDLAGGSALLGFDRSLILGYAKSFYGLSLSISPSKRCEKNDNDFECSVLARDHIGLNFSVPLGSLILYANVNKTVEGHISDEPSLAFVNNFARNSNKEANIGVTGGDALVYDININFGRSNLTYEKDYNLIEEGISLIGTGVMLTFNLGYKVLESDNVKFIAGLNNLFHWARAEYKINGYDHSILDYDFFNFDIFPNFLGETVLAKHLLIFAGARYRIHFIIDREKIDSDMEIYRLDMSSGGSSAYAGLRYERKLWAVETYFERDVLEEILNKKNPFIRLGGFIWLTLS